MGEAAVKNAAATTKSPYGDFNDLNNEVHAGGLRNLSSDFSRRL
jgi:hypothetical protein